MVKIERKYFYIGLLVLVGVVIWVWTQVLFSFRISYPEIYFLNIGQGDSSLILLPNSKSSGYIKVLIDGGRDKKVLTELEKALPNNDKYIDLVIMTHTDIDHFGGLISVLDRYKVGSFIFNGKEREVSAFTKLKRSLLKNETPIISLMAGDKIRFLSNKFDVLSPDALSLSDKSNNESGLVLMLATNGVKTLFTADIGFKTEDYLLDKYDLAADVLKVAHHGSKYSSGSRFISEVSPKVSIISVGKNNYGHPTSEVLNNLKQFGSAIYRTDLQRTIKLILNE